MSDRPLSPGLELEIVQTGRPRLACRLRRGRAWSLRWVIADL